MFEASIDLRTLEGDAGDIAGSEPIKEFAVGNAAGLPIISIIPMTASATRIMPKIHTGGRMYHARVQRC